MKPSNEEKHYIKHVIALTESMVNGLIRKTENAIITEKEKQNKILPELEEAKAAYDVVKEQYDSHQSIIDEENATLEQLVRYKTSDNSNKELKVYTKISNEKGAKVKKPRKLMDLNGAVHRILMERNHFVNSDTLFQLLFNLPELRELPHAKKQSKKHYLLDQIRKGLGGLRFYNEKIGRAEWFENGTIKPEYVRDFMG